MPTTPKRDKPILTCDIECLPNYFLILFRDIDTGAVMKFSMYNNEYSQPDVLDAVRHTMEAALSVTFNGNSFDMPIIALFLNGANNAELKYACNDIIENRLMPWAFERKYRVSVPVNFDHIDLINVAFGTASLKIYMARLNCKKLQEMPIDHFLFIMPQEREIIDHYCVNDNEGTAQLYFNLEGEIELREKMSLEYGIDLRSKSDAQIAEHVIKSEYQRLTGSKLIKPKAAESYRYNTPSFVAFQGPQLKELQLLCETVDFNISAKGAVLMPRKLNKQIKIAGKAYKMGIGGLHSVDKGGSYYSDDEYQLLDVDVGSYYPNIIINAGLEPTHIGPLFTRIYTDILTRRLAAKKSGDKIVADSLKIVVNGLFGKFGNRYSAVYSPDLMFHTTITGQLCLFMLIEQFESWGIQVVSANTDGITVKVKRTLLDGQFQSIVDWWCDFTNFTMDYAYYESAHYRDVNNYIAIDQETGKPKGKGIFAKSGIRKNPAHAIIRDAVMAYVTGGTEPQQTIFASTDMSLFLEARKVTGGAMKDGVPLGAAIRWYISDATDTAINYCKNGNQVASSDHAMPMMDLPADGLFPADLDYQWYIDKAEEILIQIGAKKQTVDMVSE
ncbi:MAG: hypothetical protein DRQ56_06710 [Gammaproteobacteria bacterium]|nr:MAG: hypothetical protein DRQ56_06710 [Gammaproteobacteria bacterium]